MADDTTQDAAQPRQAKPEFFSTPTGRTVMIVAALAVLAVVAGAAVAVVLKFVLPQPPEIDIRVPQQDQSKPVTQTGDDLTGAAQPAPPVPYDQVFRFRDIFDPLIKPAEETTVVPTETTAETPDATEYAPDTLYLISITTVDGEPTAQMVWDQRQYTLQEGDVIPDTPWRVLDIRTDSVVMLYGDQQVVLSVGQGIQK